jgi:hypothetical protein
MFFVKNACLPPAPYWKKAKEEISPFWNGSLCHLLWYKEHAHIYIHFVFTLQAPVMLNSGLHTPKSTGFFKSLRATILRSLKALGKIELQFLRGNHFHSAGPCDLDLWLTDPKINRSLLLNKDIHRMKLEGSGWNRPPVIEWKRFSLFGPLWLWPLTCWPQNK